MTDLVGVAVSSIGLTPNPISAGGSFLVSVGFRDITAFGYTLSAASWSGTGPYTQTLAVDQSITGSSEFTVFGDHTMSISQRMAEYNAVIRAEVTSAGRVLFTALGDKPDEDIPLRILAGSPPKTTTVQVSSWSGSGPWTATVGVGSAMQTALCGAVSGSDDPSASQVLDCGIHVSAVSGATVTLRAMLAKPEGTITLGVVGL